MKVRELLLAVVMLLFIASCNRSQTTSLLLENYNITENFTSGKNYFLFDAVNGQSPGTDCKVSLSTSNGTYSNESTYPIGDFGANARKSIKLIFTMPTGNATIDLKAFCS